MMKRSISSGMHEGRVRDELASPLRGVRAVLFRFLDEDVLVSVVLVLEVVVFDLPQNKRFVSLPFLCSFRSRLITPSCIV